MTRRRRALSERLDRFVPPAADLSRDGAGATRLARRYALLALCIHALVIGLALWPGLRSTEFLAGDAVTYFVPAQNLVQHHAFSRDSSPPFAWEPNRTPGYPLLMAASMALTGDFRWTLFAAALSAALAAWSAVRLAALWGGGRPAQHAAGLLAALLPNSLGLSGYLLTDALFGHLLVTWLYCVWQGFRGRSGGLLAASALLMAAMQSLKPTMNIGALLVAWAALLLVRPLRGRWRAWALALAALTLPLPLFFATMNLRSNGIFSPSLLGIETVRNYLEAGYTAEQQHTDPDSALVRLQAQDTMAARRLTEPESLAGRFYLVRRERVREFIRDHPGVALRLMATQMAIQFAAPQDFLVALFIRDPRPWVRVAGSLVTLLFFALAAWGASRIWRAGDRRPALLAGAVLAFFLVTGSVSNLVGARLRFPADMACLPLAAVGLGTLLPGRRRPGAKRPGSGR